MPNFLDTLTLNIDGLAIVHGLGKAVSILAELRWLHTAKQILYWGDIDRAGLQCLATLRRTGIRVRSILMDLDTLERFRTRSHTTATQVASYAIPECLTERETLLYRHLNTVHQGSGEDLQLEQEHIPITEAETVITGAATKTEPANSPR